MVAPRPPFAPQPPLAASRGPSRPRRSPPGVLQALWARARAHPFTHGLVGLATLGAGGALALSRFPRLDPSHERVLQPQPHRPVTESYLARWWAQRQAAQARAREAAIERNLERYRDTPLTRALAERIVDLATAVGLDPDLAFGLVHAESSFDPRARSPVGALGLTQLMPGTARWLDPSVGPSDLYDPDTNLRLGFRYLRQLVDKYGGDLRLALLAYNRGPGTVDRLLGRGADPDNGYVAKVFARLLSPREARDERMDTLTRPPAAPPAPASAQGR